MAVRPLVVAGCAGGEVIHHLGLSGSLGLMLFKGSLAKLVEIGLTFADLGAGIGNA